MVNKDNSADVMSDNTEAGETEKKLDEILKAIERTNQLLLSLNQLLSSPKYIPNTTISSPCCSYHRPPGIYG